LNDELFDLFGSVSRGFHARMQEAIASGDFGVTPWQGRLLNLIGRNAGISQLALASMTGRDKAQVARAVKALEEAGLVERSADPDNWRAWCLALTPDGRRLHKRLEAARRALADRVFRGFPEAEKASLQRSLERLDAALRG
jgi:DNA-binding MarR family transcriptional regulator